MEEFGHVDILVNNAGYGEMVPIEDTTDEHFEGTMSLNLFAAFRHFREAVQHF
ncbi:SDR family oxidoreductase [Halocatena pleomorpha]|uniref:SDR family oxidoreductase n=1 Tax=Halocatena pleomorpha TaxID=1785090 RepID=A0A3P3RNZ1_9EURY|nr:SDR family oxidoreductase [Halocatena pleomorpha]